MCPWPKSFCAWNWARFVTEPQSSRAQNSMAIKKDITSQGYDCSTVIGLGCIAGAVVLLVTEVPALALLTMGIVKVLVPERGDNPERRAERGEKLFETAIEAIE